MFCFCFLFIHRFFYFLTIRFLSYQLSQNLVAKFSGLLKLWLEMINLKIIFDPLRDVAMATNVCCFYPQNSFSGRRQPVAQPGGLTYAG